MVMLSRVALISLAGASALPAPGCPSKCLANETSSGVAPGYCWEDEAKGGCCVGESSAEGRIRTDGDRCGKCAAAGTYQYWQCDGCHLDTSRCSGHQRVRSTEEQCKEAQCEEGCLLDGECNMRVREKECLASSTKATYCYAYSTCPLHIWTLCVVAQQCYNEGLCRSRSEPGCCSTPSFACYSDDDAPFMMKRSGMCAACADVGAVCDGCFQYSPCTMYHTEDHTPALPELPTTVVTTECESGWYTSTADSSRCYRLFSDSSIAVYEAQERCETQGAELAQVENDAQFEVVKAMWKSTPANIHQGHPCPYMGAVSTGGNWSWRSGEEMTYFSVKHYLFGGAGDCSCLYEGDYSLIDVPCGFDKAYVMTLYFCSKKSATLSSSTSVSTSAQVTTSFFSSTSSRPDELDLDEEPISGTSRAVLWVGLVPLCATVMFLRTCA
eukprot:TRINITY_DN7671_c0_g2_i1.p1 TRINITY_DN7671_c0_g2~~TRINITY_DN7671_c0_g2_i1.p1  ORF type:complete len:440 (-),score=37.94 TRINITY_DN7671_c0_g2_i1:307-1626(-)